MTHAFCTVTASTKRGVSATGGRTTAPVTNLSSLAITPLWPLTQQTQNVLEINSPREFKECYHAPAAGASLPDVVEGDVLVVAGVEYPIYHVGEWTDITGGNVPCLQIVVQNIKGT